MTERQTLATQILMTWMAKGQVRTLMELRAHQRLALSWADELLAGFDADTTTLPTGVVPAPRPTPVPGDAMRRPPGCDCASWVYANGKHDYSCRAETPPEKPAKPDLPFWTGGTVTALEELAAEVGASAPCVSDDEDGPTNNYKSVLREVLLKAQEMKSAEAAPVATEKCDDCENFAGIRVCTGCWNKRPTAAPVTPELPWAVEWGGQGGKWMLDARFQDSDSASFYMDAASKRDEWSGHSFRVVPPAPAPAPAPAPVPVPVPVPVPADVAKPGLVAVLKDARRVRAILERCNAIPNGGEDQGNMLDIMDVRQKLDTVIAAMPTVAANFAEERDRWLALADKWQADPSLDGNAAFEAGVMAVIGRVRTATKMPAPIGTASDNAPAFRSPMDAATGREP